MKTGEATAKALELESLKPKLTADERDGPERRAVELLIEMFCGLCVNIARIADAADADR